MKRSSLFLSVIVCFSFVLVGCTDCNDDTSASVDESPVSFAEPSASVNEPSASIDDPPAPIDEPPVSPPPLGLCGGANSASERSLWNADLSNQHNENLHPADEVPTPLDDIDESTLSSICDRDDLDSDYIVWNGDVTIDNLESLEGYTLIKGDIRMYDELSLEIVDLPELQIVCGTISMRYSRALTTINLQNLQAVEGDFYLEGESALLTNIDLPQLQIIGGSGTFASHHAVTSINLSQLQFVGDTFWLSSNTNLLCLDLSRLQTVGSFHMRGNTSLERINLSNLQTVGRSFTLSDSSVILGSIDLPQLQTIHDYASISGHDGATSINLPQLQSVGQSFNISSNNNLTSIDLSQLKTVGLNTERTTRGGLVFFKLKGGDFLNIALPQLQSIGGDLLFVFVYSTTDVLIPQLQTIGRGLRIEYSSGITSIALPQLQSVGESFDPFDAGEESFTFDEYFEPTQCNLGSYTNDQCP